MSIRSYSSVSPERRSPYPSLEWGIRTGLDYATEGARQHMLSIIFELIQRFDIDGIELDFMRHPAFFRVEDAFAQRYLMTDLVRQVRNKLDHEGERVGRDLSLAVRVPPTLNDCLRIGLDAEEWMQQGLVDLLIGGGGFIPFAMPIRSFVEAARGTSCKVFGCFEALRPTLDEDVMQALAARYWEAGVDALLLQLLQHVGRVEARLPGAISRSRPVGAGGQAVPGGQRHSRTQQSVGFLLRERDSQGATTRRHRTDTGRTGFHDADRHR